MILFNCHKGKLLSVSLRTESKLLAKHSFIYASGNLLSTIAAFLLLPVYTRYLTPRDYGIKELVGLSTDVIGILVATAISSAMYRFYFEYEEEKERNEVISSSFIAVGAMGLLTVAILSFFTRTMAKYILDSPALYHFFIISFASMWFQSLNNLGFDYLKAQQKSLIFILFSLGKLIMAIAINIYLVVYLEMGVLGVLISTLFTAIITTIFLLVPIFLKTGIRFSWSKTKEMFKFGLPLVASQFGAFIVHLSDRFFLKAYTSLSDTGLYSLGYRFGAIPNNFISGPFNQIYQPRRFELYKKENSEKIFGKIFTYFLAIILFAGLGVSILTKDVLMIISDPKFWSAYKITPIIVLATTIFSFHYHFNLGILIAKKTKYLAYINFSNGLMVLVLNFLLIKPYGAFGAAYATLLAFIYKVSLTYYFSSKYYKIYFEFLRITKLVLAGIMIYLSSLLVDFSLIYLNIICKILLLFCYPVLIYCSNFFTSDEKAELHDIIKPRIRALKAVILRS